MRHATCAAFRETGTGTGLRRIEYRRSSIVFLNPGKKILMRLLLSLAAIAIAHSAIAAPAAAPATETLPSGVTIEHLKVGDGASPKASDTVTVHYRGTLENGKEFDSSYARNSPASFPLSRVIPCWTEGVQKMKVGGKTKLTCPPKTAYGERGAGSAVPPNATLNFEVELLSIAK